LPACAEVGVPLSAPVAELKVAHAGLPAIENPRESPLGSLVVGTKLYGEVACTEPGGEPLMDGGELAPGGGAGSAGSVALWTVKVNAGSDATAIPSDTEIITVDVGPMFAAEGVPDTMPVCLSIVAQVGRPEALKVSVSPSRSVAWG